MVHPYKYLFYVLRNKCRSILIYFALQNEKFLRLESLPKPEIFFLSLKMHLLHRYSYSNNALLKKINCINLHFITVFTCIIHSFLQISKNCTVEPIVTKVQLPYRMFVNWTVWEKKNSSWSEKFLFRRPKKYSNLKEKVLNIGTHYQLIKKYQLTKHFLQFKIIS